MTLSLKSLEKQYYKQIYEGKTILIKVSGAEICSPNFEKALKDIEHLIENDIKVILVFGGGEQIDACYFENTGNKERPKINGVAVTTKEILEQGVIPAYRKIENHLRTIIEARGLTEETSFIPPEEVRAVQRSRKWGYTGSVRSIPLDFEKKLSFVGFLGSNGKKTYFNVNADEIATFFVKQYNINEVIFITKTGGILDVNGEIVDFLGLSAISKILADKHKMIKADGGMKKKVKEIQSLLQYVSKVAVIKLDGILDEMTRLEGHGTLCANLQWSAIEACQDDELFDLVYAHFVSRGIWKKRSAKEKKEARENHFLLMLDGTPLGGYSLVHRPYPLNPEIEGISIECWWAGKEKNGIGRRLVEKAILESALQDEPLFLYTKQDILKIHKGFKGYPKIKSETGAKLWVREL